MNILATKIIFAIILFNFSSVGWAASTDEDVLAPTAYLDFGAGLMTYKSKLVSSNDTSNAVQYTLGFNSKGDSNMGVAVRNETSTTPFEYGPAGVGSSIVSTFQDIILRYNFGYFFFGLVFAQSKFVVDRFGSPYMDTLGTGYGVNLGLGIPLAKKVAMTIEATSASSSQVKDTLQTTNTVAIGSRTEIFLGAVVPITSSFFNFSFGLKQRTYAITVDQAYAELQRATWLGLSLRGDL